MKKLYIENNILKFKGQEVANLKDYLTTDKIECYAEYVDYELWEELSSDPKVELNTYADVQPKYFFHSNILMMKAKVQINIEIRGKVTDIVLLNESLNFDLGNRKYDEAKKWDLHIENNEEIGYEAGLEIISDFYDRIFDDEQLQPKYLIDK